MERRCLVCEGIFRDADTETWWDFKGSGYDTHLARCPCCGRLTILGYKEEPDRTAWYYEYGRKTNGRI